MINQLLRQQLGKRGEDLAVTYLQNKGYTILSRNFKARYGEIDIIAQQGNTLVFVEVKTRTSDSYGTPEEAVTGKKLQEVIQASQVYLLRNPKKQLEPRVDVIAIESRGERVTIRHIKNVTM